MTPQQEVMLILWIIIVLWAVWQLIGFIKRSSKRRKNKRANLLLAQSLTGKQ